VNSVNIQYAIPVLKKIILKLLEIRTSKKIDRMHEICVLQGTVVTLYRCAEQDHNHLSKNFLKIMSTGNYTNRLIFDRGI